MNPLDLVPFRTLLDQVVVPARRHVRRTLLPIALPLVVATLTVSVAQVRWSQVVLDPASQEDPTGFLLGAMGILIVAFVALFVYGMAYYALTTASMDAVAGREVHMRRAWAYVFRPPVFATLFIVVFLNFLSVIMCFLPALYVVPLLSFTLPVMIEEKRYGMDAVSRSAELFRFNATGEPTHSPWLQTLGLLFVGFVLANAISGVAQAPFIVAQQIIALREAATSGDMARQMTMVMWLQVPSSILGALATAVTWLYTTFGICLLYRELRRRKEADDMAEAIDELTGERSPSPLAEAG